MQDTEEKINSLTNEEIIKLSLRTMWWSFISIMLALVMFVSFFPYNAMKIYNSMGLKERTLETAESYLNRNNGEYNEKRNPSYNSKYADALLMAVNKSVILMNDNIKKQGYYGNKTEFYAKKVNKHINNYNSYLTMNTRTNLIDDYNLKHSSPYYYPYVSSFKNFLATSQTTSRLILGDIFKLYNEIGIELGGLDNAGFTVDEYNIGGYIDSFNKINAILSSELNKTGYFNLNFEPDSPPIEDDIRNAKFKFEDSDFNIIYNKTEKTKDGITMYEGASTILRRIQSKMEEFITFINSYNIYNAPTPLEQLNRAKNKIYWSKSIRDIVTNTRNTIGLIKVYWLAFENNSTDIFLLFSEWENIYMTEYTGEVSPISIESWFKKHVGLFAEFYYSYYL